MNKIQEYFSDFVFVEDGHKYYHKHHPEVDLTSSTGIKSQYIPEFRRKYWLAWAAIKERYPFDRSCDASPRNTAPQDHFIVKGKQFHYEEIYKYLADRIGRINKEWESESTFGKIKGNFVHKYLENYVTLQDTQSAYSLNPTQDSEILKYIYQAHYYITQNPPQGIPECEVITGDLRRKATGTIDRLDVLDSNWCDIWDYKSDKDFTTQGGLYDLKPPFDHLTTNSLDEYSIQVNIYADIIEYNTPYKVRNLKIANICKDKYEIYDVNRFHVLK